MVIQLPEISIIIVGYKAKKYLDACLKSIQHQTIYNSANIEVIFIDNASFDGSIAHIQRNYKWVSTVRNMKNIGFGPALNQGIKCCSGEYVLLMNPDVILEKDYLEQAVKKMQHDRHIAAMMGKVYQYDFNTSGKTPYFDTVGVHAYIDREILSARGARDEGQFEDPQEIFSIRNICGFYRKSALEDARIMGDYFDENFFLYLEDVDLCWRLHLFGWKVFFQPSMVSYHFRDTRKKATIEKSKAIEKRQFIINERLMLLKNEFVGTMIRDFWSLSKKRLTKSFLKLHWLKGWFKYLKMLPQTLKSRKIIMKRKRVTRFDMRKWFIYKSKHLEKYAKLPPTY
ncbi:glycosyltransferase family 2 protein [Patescibacteria group bacterium]